MQIFEQIEGGCAISSLTSMPVDPKLVDFRIDQRIIADKHVNLGQHVEVTFALSRYAIDHRRKIVTKIMLT